MQHMRWASTAIILILALAGSGVPVGATSALIGAAQAAAPSSCVDTFSDLPTDNIYYAYAHALTCAGVMSAYPDGSFRGSESVTRGEMARWVALAAGYTDAIAPDQQTFTDVPPSDPNWLYIERLHAHGIIDGYVCGSAPGGPCPGRYFRPEHYVIRAQTAKLVTLAAGITDAIPTNRQTFSEVPATHPFWLFVERAAAHGLVSGYACDNVTYNVCGGRTETCPGTYFRCCANVTRTQAAKIIALAFMPAAFTP